MGLWAGLLVWVVMTTPSCLSPRKNVKPPVSIPSAFSNQGQNKLADRWWLSFQDNELDRLINRTMRKNLTLRASWDRLKQAAAALRSSSAGLFPMLNYQGSGNLSYMKQKGLEGFSKGASFGLAASYELDVWGRVRSLRDAAKLDFLATQATLAATAISLSAEVANTWYRLVEGYGQLDLLERQIATNQQILKLVTLRFRLGQSGAADVLQQKQAIESKRGEKTRVIAQVKVLEHGLALLLGEPPKQGSFQKKTQLVQLPPLPNAGLPSQLIQRRPDVMAAFFRVQSSHRRVAAAIADRFPKFSIAANASIGADGIDKIVSNWLLNLVANVLGPIFDGGRRKAEVKRRRAAASEALNNYGQSILRAFKEVEDALVREKQQRLYIKSLEKQQSLAKLVLERTKHSYSNGAETYLRVLDSLLRYQTLERGLLSARRDLLLYRIALCRALAGGWKLSTPPKTK